MYSHNYNIPSNMRKGYQSSPYTSSNYSTNSMNDTVISTSMPNTVSNVSMNGGYPTTMNGSMPVTSMEDDRFFWAPFVVGGLAGTALGYGIANNNQINNRPPVIYGPFPPPMYPAPYPPVYTTNYYY